MGARRLPDVPVFIGKSLWETQRLLQEFLDDLRESVVGPTAVHAITHQQGNTDPLMIPEVVPPTIIAGAAGTRGTGPSNMLENARPAISTSTSIGLANANSEGVGPSLLRADAGIKRDVRIFVDGAELAIRNALNLVGFTVIDDLGNDRVTIEGIGAAVVLSPTQLTANQNNYAPGAANIYRLTSDASRNITGLVAGTNGEIRYAINVGSFNIVLQHDNAGSTAANRFITPLAANLTLDPGDMALLLYDTLSSRWRAFELVGGVFAGVPDPGWVEFWWPPSFSQAPG